MHNTTNRADCLALLDDVSDAVLIVDPTWSIIYQNRRVAQLAGHSSAATQARTLWSMYPDLVGTPIEASLRAAMAKHEAVTHEFFDAPRDRWIQLRLSPRASGAAVYVLDVTALHHAQSRVQRLYEAPFIGVQEWDLDGRVTAANDALLQMLGYSRSELEAGALNWMAMTPPEFGHLDDLLIGGVTTAGHTQMYEKEYLDKRGRRVPVLIAAVALDPLGQHNMALVLDIRERRRLDALFHRAQRHQAVATLAGGLAHELNNLMAVVLGFGHLVLEALPPGGAASSELRADVEQIIAAARHAATITHQVLAFSRQQVLAPATLDCNTVVRELRPALTSLLGSTTALVLDLDPDLPRARGDRHRLEQVLIALVDNARAAITVNGQVSLRTRPLIVTEAMLEQRGGELRPGQYVAIAVQDNGSGMNAATLERVFDPFFTTRSPGEGRGLGIPSAFGIMRQSGGDLWIDSAPGAGTTVTLLLPVASSAPTAGDAPSTIDSTLGEAESRSPRADAPLALLVQPDPITGALARRTLERAGLRVIEAARGDEALNLAGGPGRDPIGLVVSDLRLPDMDGPSLVHRLRTLGVEAPALYLSGSSEEELAVRARLRAGDRVLLKPLFPRTLIAATRAALADVAAT